MKATIPNIPRWGRTVAIGATMFALVAQAVLSQENNGRVIVPHSHPTGHVHDHADQTWPPQPPGLTKVVDFSNPGIEQLRHKDLQLRFAQLEQVAGTRSPLTKALGHRFSRITVIDEAEKGKPPHSSRFVYFSQENNSTVEVTFNGVAIQAINTIAPSEYQPEITEEEVLAATQIARTHFLSLGLTRVQDLQGYGILAYQPEGKGFYDSRVIYISFHVDNDSRPELVAWVDLSHQTILDAREER
ncbi:MAG: hypothetical protein AB7G75_17745 [Candidatus Binatia bacterium]